MNWNLALAVISTLTALAAVLSNIFTTKYAAKRQFAAHVLSTHRQAWINQLREEIAQFISVTNAIALDSVMGRLDPMRYADQSYKIYGHWARIHLLANQKEKDHLDLLKMIDDAISAVYRDETQPTAMRTRTDALILKAQEVLKREWERVKSGE